MTRAEKTAAVVFVAFSAVVRANDALADGVPVDLQAQLTAKITAFDRNFAERADGTARVLVVQKSGDGDSADMAAHFARALETVHMVAGLNIKIDFESLTTATALAERCRSQRISVVYLSTHLDDDVGAVATALAGADVLTVGAAAGYAARGAVVAFDLEEGKARIVVNLARAKSQNVSFRAELLKLTRLVASTGSS